MAFPVIPIAIGSDGKPREAPELLALQAVKSLKPKGYTQVSLATAAVSLTIPTGVSIALIRVENQPVRYRDDGSDPTSAVGMPIDVGDTLIYDAQMNSIRVIGQASGAILNIAFYGPIDA